jgi:hypothetical protein
MVSQPSYDPEEPVLAKYERPDATISIQGVAVRPLSVMDRKTFTHPSSIMSTMDTNTSENNPEDGTSATVLSDRRGCRL